MVMSSTSSRWHRRGPIQVLVLVFAGCAAPAPAPEPGGTPLEQRLSDLERRIELLEARPQIMPPFRNRAEIEAHIQVLEAERTSLLTRYFAEHPLIRDIDRQLLILNTQLKMIE
jgi:hypothetical protein